MRKKYSVEEKVMWLEDWRGSGKSARAYAQENGISPQTFINWTKDKTSKETDFVEVTAAVRPVAAYAPEMRVEKGNMKIYIPLAVSLSEWERAIEAVGRVVCYSM